MDDGEKRLQIDDGEQKTQIVEDGKQVQLDMGSRVVEDGRQIQLDMDSSAAAIPQPPSSTVQTSAEPPRTLWMGDLDPSFDEATIQNIWLHLNKQVSVKLIRAKKNLLIPCSTSSTFNANSGSPNTEGASTGFPSGNDSGSGSGSGSGSSSDTSSLPSNTGPKININGVSFIDPNTTQLHHAGYCFVEFESLADAQWALTLNSSPLPDITCGNGHVSTNPSGLRNFRLNWASGATLLSAIPSTPEFSLFVGDLSPTATEAHLLSLFQKKFKSVKTVRVMTDPITGASRCFGFVRFGDEQERRRALVEMNGVWCQGRNLRVAYATPRNNVMWQLTQNSHQSQQNDQFLQNDQLPHFQHRSQVQSHHQHHPRHHLNLSQIHQHQHASLGFGSEPAAPSQYQTSAPAFHPNNYQMTQSNYSQAPLLMKTANSLVNNNLINFPASDVSSDHVPAFMAQPTAPRSAFTNPNNTTVFIGGLTSQISERQLHSLFSPFGAIINVKIPPGKGCGFVKYAYRIDAEAAIQGMQGFIVGGNPIRLSWGRTSADTGRHSAMQDMPSCLPAANLNRAATVWNQPAAPGSTNSMFASSHLQRQDSPSQMGTVPPVHPSLL